MRQKFEKHIKSNSLFLKTDKLLVTISGGRDSMLMLYLLASGGYNISVAHCNFQLRGDESEGDEEFVKKYCEKYNVPFFFKRFNTKAYSKLNKFSTQEAARKLRYDWFEQLHKDYKFKYILTAHHKDDNLETILYNLVKGSKLRGYGGIRAANEKLVRPMLCYTREDIDLICKKLSLSWREDTSNISNDYSRNFLRNEVIPLLKKINPNIEETVYDNSRATQRYIGFIDASLSKIEKKCIVKKKEYLYIYIDKLLKNSVDEVLLWEILKKYGFNYTTSKNIFLSLKSQPGKIWETGSHQILKDRDCLILREKMERKLLTYKITEKQIGSFRQIVGDREIQIQKGSKSILIRNEGISIAKQKLSYPITLRHWKPADKILLKGMTGAKKVSDLITDFKFNLFEKEQIFVIQNGDGELVSVDFLKVSEKFLAKENTANNLIISTVK